MKLAIRFAFAIALAASVLLAQALGRKIELAVAGGAAAIVTNNIAEFRFSDLRFPDLRVLTPKDLQRELA